MVSKQMPMIDQAIVKKFGAGRKRKDFGHVKNARK
jgi:hypothetical protein